MALDELAAGHRGGACHRVADVGSAESADLRAVHDLGAPRDGGDRTAAAERLGQSDQVRLQAVVLAGEHAPGTPEAGLDLVDHQQDPVLPTESRPDLDV